MIVGGLGSILIKKIMTKEITIKKTGIELGKIGSRFLYQVPAGMEFYLTSFMTINKSGVGPGQLTLEGSMYRTVGIDSPEGQTKSFDGTTITGHSSALGIRLDAGVNGTGTIKTYHNGVPYGVDWVFELYGQNFDMLFGEGVGEYKAEVYFEDVLKGSIIVTHGVTFAEEIPNTPLSATDNSIVYETIVTTSPIYSGGDYVMLQVNSTTEAETVPFDIVLTGILTGDALSSGKMYTDVSSVGAYLGITIPDAQTEQVEEWINAMSLYADEASNRVLQDDAITTHKYDGDNSDLILIDDVTGAFTAKENDKVISVIGYPANKPYKSRIARTGGYRFASGQQNIEITGIHAMFSEVPSNVKLATTILVAGIYNARYSKKAGKSEKIGNYSVTYTDDTQEQDFKNAKDIISSYRRIAL